MPCVNRAPLTTKTRPCKKMQGKRHQVSLRLGVSPFPAFHWKAGGVLGIVVEFSQEAV